MVRTARRMRADTTLMVALVRMREEPVPHCWQRRTSLFSRSGIAAGFSKIARSVVASSYVPRGERGSPVFPPAAGCCRVRCRHPDRRLGAPARPASILKPWRLSGLLSGCPPTDTRPQARAKLGKAQIRTLAPSDKYFFDTPPNIGRKPAAIRVCELWRGWTRIVHAAVSCVPPIQSRPAIGHRA